MTDKYGYILTIEERYWNRFCRLNKAGKNTYAYVSIGVTLSDEVRQVFFYSGHPFQEIVGFADVVERKIGDSRELWNSHGQETCLNSYDEYLSLICASQKVTFIRFRNLHVASSPVPFDQISDILQTERMSQIGMYVNKTQADLLVRILK